MTAVHNRVETHIDAPRAAVWRVLADFEGYPAWNPFTPQVLGRCAAGEDVRVLVKLQGEPFWMPRRVTCAEPDRRFAWVGRAWYSWLAPGERSVTLEDHPDGGTVVIDDEVVGGVGVLMGPGLRETLRAQLVAFGEGLKGAVERGDALRNGS